MADSKTISGYWAEFPATYRAEQVATIMQWLAAEESGVVIGGSGTGKSNLAGFLSSRPDAIAPHTRRPDSYCFLHLDINSLPALTAPLFYRGMAQTLQDTSEHLDTEIQQGMQQLAQAQVNWDDSFAVLTLLRKMHHLLIRQAGKKAIWLMDRFDEACRRLDAQTLNSLRSLRDQFKGQLCYVVFTRHPLARLRDPGEIDEFHEIVARNTCWVGAMVERDARWIARQMAERLQATFREAEVKQLIEVSGGLPAFLKLGCLALHEGTLEQSQPGHVWVKQLLTQPEFQRNCQELWDDLSVEEQNVLLALSAGASETMLDPDIVAYLEQTGLLTRSAPGASASFFSPILAAFIAQQRGTTAGIIELHPKTRAVLRGGIPLNVELTAHEDRLLSFFLEHPGEVCGKDTLMRAVWPNEQVVEGIRDDRLAQLIKRLRDKIEPDPAQPAYIQAVRGRGYRFAQP
jgi:DNA-binding winged helix-turn-helix (wHTH) protein